MRRKLRGASLRNCRKAVERDEHPIKKGSFRKMRKLKKKMILHDTIKLTRVQRASKRSEGFFKMEAGTPGVDGASKGMRRSFKRESGFGRE